MNGSQQDDDVAIQHFLQWRNSQRQRGCVSSEIPSERFFVPWTAVNAYFRDRRRVQSLLEGVFPERDPAKYPATETIQDSYPRTFCILLCIGNGRFINHFIQRGLGDQRLPLEEKPEAFPHSTIPYWNDFEKQQWEFCAPTFRYDMDRYFGAMGYVLPIVHKENLREGGSSSTYKIVLHESYDELHPDYRRRAVSRPLPLAEDLNAHHIKGSSEPTAHTYVLKTYRTKDAERYYKKEVDGFKRLRYNGHDGSPCSQIIGFYGNFVQNDTYNILLEYADKGTLEDYFKDAPSPSSGHHVVAFWEELLRGVFDGLIVIHVAGHNESEEKPMFHGWHQDLKPANILVKAKSNDGDKSHSGVHDWYNCHFKIADLGLSHFRKTVKSSEAVDKDARGTRTYGAPECYRNSITEESTLAVKQNVDVWSLGCVLSEAVVWAVRGYHHVQEYRQRRADETREIDDFDEDDCFHDRFDVLKSVGEAHKASLEDCRPKDHVTHRVVQLIEEGMLVPAKARLDANQLSYRASLILKDARKELGIDTHKDLPEDTQESRPSSQSTGYDTHQQALHVVSSDPSSTNQGQQGSHVTQGKRPLSHSPNHSLDHRETLESVAESQAETIVPIFQSMMVASPSGQASTFPAAPPPGSPARQPSPRPQLPALDPPAHLLGRQGLTSPSSNSVHRRSTSRPAEFLSFEQAMQWKRNKKMNKPATLPGNHLLSELSGRDCAFLIDDASSMRPYWSKVKDCLGLLGHIVKTTDKEFEVYFTMNWTRSKPKQVKNATMLVAEAEKRHLVGQSNMREALGRILDEYKGRLDKPGSSRLLGSKKSVKRLILYILTDGVWQDNCDIEPMIMDMVRTTGKLGLLNAQIGIQFIQFGKDEEGSRRLEYFDNGLGLEGNDDIVDSEPFEGGDVWKMLLGSVNKGLDGDAERNKRATGVDVSSRFQVPP